ncbi:MAG: phenylalanine--tRNA ligase subunit alpha [Rickettsiales bacterium]|nr:phenylalanine--tRNA ligase subunit alpha [Rickettsiales bacterium]
MKKAKELSLKIDRNLKNVKNLQELELIKVNYTGKKGVFTSLLRSLSSLDNQKKAIAGKSLNLFKSDIEHKINSKKEDLKKLKLNESLIKDKIDITLPARPIRQGGIHPISKTIDEIVSIMGSLGFNVEEGPHIEDDYYNFTALNIPEEHPARQEHDTFYLNGKHKKKLLRTHTSPVQIRTMKEKVPPIKIIVPGSTYRCDDDATHSPMFHQIEGLVVDENISMANLKWVIKKLLSSFFNVKSLPMRFRPSYFPFTEPSAEVDIGCSIDNGKLVIGEGKDWLEVLGCGIINPHVFENCTIDTKKYSGFAFGLGVERFAMLKYGITDLRMFYENDHRWLKYHSFIPKGFPNILKGL